MGFDFSFAIDHASSRPIYVQLLDIISSQIENGLLRPEDLLPSENEFCEAYHISRTTVRQTLHELERRGMGDAGDPIPLLYPVGRLRAYHRQGH